MARYILKRPVEISVQHMPAGWAGRCAFPAHYIACIVGNGPRSMRGEVAQGRTRADAIAAMIDRLRSAGYTGTAKIERGGAARPPWG